VIQLLETARLSELHPDSISRCALIDACAIGGQLQLAEQVYLDSVVQGFFKPWAFAPLLDLHDLSVEVSKIAIQTAIAEVQRGERQVPKRVLGVIVGIGEHSTRGLPVLKPAIMAWLRDELSMEFREDRSNKGVLRIPLGRSR